MHAHRALGTALAAAPAPAAKKAAAEPDGDEADELARAKETIAQLRERTSSLMAEKDALSKDAEALKKQAKGLSDEYGRMLAQKESLENKFADFELLMGDEVKKSK